MSTLHRLDLVSVLREVAVSGKPLVGICLGIQLLMSEGYEFGFHKGLDIVEGSVVPFESPRQGNRILKVPQVQWNQIFRTKDRRFGIDPWKDTPLAWLAEGAFLYFVHSFFVCPADPSVALSVSRYGHIEFCSSLRRQNIFACQFHPERSGQEGLSVYQNISVSIQKTKEVQQDVKAARG